MSTPCATVRRLSAPTAERSRRRNWRPVSSGGVDLPGRRAVDASAVLGKPEVVGAQVSPPGTYRATIAKARTGNGQLVEGALFWRRFLRKKLAAERAEAAAAQTPSYGSRGYLALTADDLVLVGVDASVRVKLTEPLATISRTQIASAELGKAGVMLGSLPLSITLTNGDEWMFEVPCLVGRKGKHLVAELAERPHAGSGRSAPGIRPLDEAVPRPFRDLQSVGHIVS